MKIIIKQPQHLPKIEDVDNTPEMLDALVGGQHESITQMCEGVAIICDSEMLCKNKPYNITIGGNDYRGTILVVGEKNGKFCDLSGSQTFRWERALRN